MEFYLLKIVTSDKYLGLFAYLPRYIHLAITDAYKQHVEKS